MGLRYESDLLSFLGLKKEFLRDDFDFIVFKQALLLNIDREDLLDNLLTLLKDERPQVKKNAIRGIYFLVMEVPNIFDDETTDLIKSLIHVNNIDITFDELRSNANS